ncbi:MAG: DUF924 domain-containing protein [Gammaproteobacteria bacterium]|nr:DUF924 domain-containing protein [Gammaproteobacteria bacterium]
MTASDILSFWFEEISSKQWFKQDSDFDALIKERFLSVHQCASSGELFTWRDTATGRLAEIIVLDQFSRNIFRNHPDAFASDNLALVLAQEAVNGGALEALEQRQQAFLIMPYMHSESGIIHEEAVKLFSRPGLEFNLDFEHKHKDIIDQFGRYPHRNALLGRESTPEEEKFLSQPGSSF